MPERRSIAEIRLGIMQTIKKGLEEGEKVGTWYVVRNLGIGYPTLKRHEQFLTENGYLKRENKYLDLTDKAKDVVGYFEKTALKKLSSAEQFLETIGEQDDFNPMKIIKKKAEEPPTKALKRSNEHIMFDFLNEVKDAGEKGAIPTLIGNSMSMGFRTTIRYGDEAEKNGYVFHTSKTKGGKEFRRYFITEKGKEWLTETPERRVLNQVISKDRTDVL